MNCKGVLFTMMAFLIITSILGLNNVIETKAENKQPEEANALNRLNNRFDNIKENIVDLKSDATLKYLNETILPFTYFFSEDRKSLLIAQELPSNRGVLDNFFDVINIYAILSQNPDFSKGVYFGMDVNIETVGNQLWGGNDSNSLEFMVRPFCLKFYLNDVNKIGFIDSNSGTCLQEFVTDNLAGYDLNVIIKQATEDYNRVTCSFGGSSDCLDLGGSLTDPYFELNIRDSSCLYCGIDDALKSIKGNYDPEAVNTITIFCQGSECTSQPITISFGKGLSVEHEGTRIEARAEAKFNSKISSFEFNDFNITVSEEDLNMVKTNKPNYLN